MEDKMNSTNKSILDYLPKREEKGPEPTLPIQCKVPRALGLETRKALRKEGIKWNQFLTAAMLQYRDVRKKKTES